MGKLRQQNARAVGQYFLNLVPLKNSETCRTSVSKQILRGLDGNLSKPMKPQHARNSKQRRKRGETLKNVSCPLFPFFFQKKASSTVVAMPLTTPCFFPMFLNVGKS